MGADNRLLGLRKAIQVKCLLKKILVDCLSAEFFMDELQFKLFGGLIAHGNLIVVYEHPYSFPVN